jgi:hypothetical protein
MGKPVFTYTRKQVMVVVSNMNHYLGRRQYIKVEDVILVQLELIGRWLYGIPEACAASLRVPNMNENASEIYV